MAGGYDNSTLTFDNMKANYLHLHIIRGTLTIRNFKIKIKNIKNIIIFKIHTNIFLNNTFPYV